MRQDERAAFEEALRGAREAAWRPGEYVEQESFMRAGEILALARRAGIGPGVDVLDVCCGVAGPGRFVTRELGCSYVGVDASASAVAIARGRAHGLPCRFEVGEVPPFPSGTFDVVLLLETMLAFRDKQTLADAVACSLRRGGRFAFTLEEGLPLTEAERAQMPDADTVWLTPLGELQTTLEATGLAVGRPEDLSSSHREMADRLADAFEADADAIASRVGRRAVDDLVAGHRLWSGWLATGRVRKLALVAERV
ncbi:MAG TPA: class I SAM-dependent methyltransferase [Gaiellaceae bacterium]|nr:class I SAM-dependent methyltransferase [Gaiellaceae bacterium]